MLTTLDLINLTWARACKNRASLDLALDRANRYTTDPTLLTAIQACTTGNNHLIDQLNAILEQLTGTPDSLQP